MLKTLLCALPLIPLCGAETPAPQKKTICLNMIVKNESDVITRCLDSVRPLIDTWVIVDTGSTDGTQEVIKKHMKDIPGELYEKPWVNFGYNREEALQLAKNKADYILFMDADDKLSFDPQFKLPELNLDFYAIPTRSKDTECVLPRLIKSSVDWHWHDVLHEYIQAKEETKGAMLDGVEYVYLHEGSRAKDPQRCQKDIEVLHQGLKIDPENSRYVFYLGMTYMHAGDYKNALKYFEQRAEMGGIEQVVFVSKLHVAKLQDELKMDKAVIEKSYADAFKYFPSRIEPLYYLVKRAREEGSYQKGFDIASLALHIPRSYSVFLEKSIWEYALLTEYAICAYYVQKYKESSSACDKVLALQDIPANYRTEMESLQKELHSITIEKVQSKIFELITPK